MMGAAMLAGATTMAAAQSSKSSQNRPAQRRARRESNASRQARIARTIEATYAHQLEVMGGGGFLRWRSGPYTQRNDEVSWNAQGYYYLNPRLGIVADTQGSFGNAKPLRGVDNTNVQAARPQINEYFFTGGANYRFLRKEKYTLGIQGTGGVAWGIFLRRRERPYGNECRALERRLQAGVHGVSERRLQRIPEPGGAVGPDLHGDHVHQPVGRLVPEQLRLQCRGDLPVRAHQVRVR